MSAVAMVTVCRKCVRNCRPVGGRGILLMYYSCHSLLSLSHKTFDHHTMPKSVKSCFPYSMWPIHVLLISVEEPVVYFNFDNDANLNLQNGARIDLNGGKVLIYSYTNNPDFRSNIVNLPIQIRICLCSPYTCCNAINPIQFAPTLSLKRNAP